MPPIICVIPSRYGAQRFPGKPLADLLGKPMIQWVWETARKARRVDEVLVATDDERIREVVEGFGGTVAMTAASCPSGSDRIATALRGRECAAIVNLQGDEPMMHPETVTLAVEALLENPHCDVATACIELRDRAAFENPMVVKVVRGHNDTALYFSRSPIPNAVRLDEAITSAPNYLWGYKHLGIYVYRPQALRDFVAMPRSPLEISESLEQLRFLEAGYRIRCVETKHDSIGVDTPGDLKTVAEILARRGSQDE
jgi:3-deoxy-manno-octulosonate cytidylyltransferase (CMP-KDO synthetase)